MPMNTRLPVALIAVTGIAYSAFTGLSLRIGDQVQPPGGVVQMQVFLTEPKPISTGRGRLAMQQSLIANIDGVSLISSSGDAAGAAVVNGTNVRLVCSVPSNTLGSVLDFPILTVTGNIRPDAAIGSTMPLYIAPSNLIFLDPNGQPYPKEVKQGLLTIADNVSITDISPGSAAIPAGAEVVIKGLNFTPTTRVKFKEVSLDSTTYVSPTEIRVTVGVPVNMHGAEITVTNPDGTEAIYYSFQRTIPAGNSVRALFNATIPIYEYQFWTSAVYGLPVASGTKYSGITVQNLRSTPTSIVVALVSSTGSVIGSRGFSLPPNRRLTRETVEYVAGIPPAGSYWRVRSNAPVQSLGLIGDDSTGLVSPVVPASAQ